MELAEMQKDGVLIVEPHGRIDSVGSIAFGERLSEAVHSGSHHLLIDLQHILYISSAGFRSLLIAHKLVHEVQGKLVLCGMSSEVRRLFDIGTFSDIFTICASRDEGITIAK